MFGNLFNIGLPDRLYVGQLVRVVNMQGCMAHIRGDMDQGIIFQFVSRTPYGSQGPARYAQIELFDKNSAIIERPADISLWATGPDGVWEYRQ